jgi:hypothetical protein
MAQHTRSELYKIYKGGFHDKAFEHLVDSSLNIKDDGIGLNPDHGLILTSKGPSKSLVSFYQKISDKSTPLWTFGLDSQNQSKGLNILEGHKSRMFIQNGGLVGINTTNPNYQLDVNGLVASRGVVGTYARGTADADGKWHTLTNLRNMEGCIIFEIIAHINDVKDKRFGLTLATLMLTHGKKGYKNKVFTTGAGSKWLWGKFMNKIHFRWVVDDLNTEPGKERYMIQMKSKSHFGMLDGQPKKMFYRVRKLWDKEYELDQYPDKEWDDGFEYSPTSHIMSQPTANPSPSSGGRKSLTIKRK